MFHAGLGQPVGRVMTWRDDGVEPLIGLGPEVEGGLLGPVAQVKGGQRGRIRVAEPHNRHA